MITYTRENQGVCSARTVVTLDEGVITDIRVDEGCDGNLQGVCALLVGRSAQACIPLLRDIRCEGRPTSCPQQIALCLDEALKTQG